MGIAFFGYFCNQTRFPQLAIFYVSILLKIKNMASTTPSKRFVLFVRNPMTVHDAPPVRFLQESGAALRTHVSLFPVTAENVMTLPPAVQQTTPLIFDAVKGTFSNNPLGVLQTMFRMLQSVGATESNPAHASASAPGPVPTSTRRVDAHHGGGVSSGPRGPPAPPPVQSIAVSASRVTTPLDLGDGYLAASQTEAPDILETRSFISGKGFAGSTFGGAVSRGSRIDGDADWVSATVSYDETAAQHYMHEQFGLMGGNSTVSHSAPMTTVSDRQVSETKKLKDDDADVQALIDRRNALDEMYKIRQRGGAPSGPGPAGGPPSGPGGVSAGGSTAFSLMHPPQSREERTAGIEGMMLLRPLSNPPVRREEGAAAVPPGLEGMSRGTF